MMININPMSNEELRELQAKLINLSLHEVNLDIERCKSEGDFEGVEKFSDIKDSIVKVLDYIDVYCI